MTSATLTPLPPVSLAAVASPLAAGTDEYQEHLWTLAADGWTGSGPNTAAACYTRSEQRKVEHAKSDTGNGEILGFLRGECVLNLRCRGVDGGCGFLNLNRAGDLADLKRDVRGSCFVQLDGDGFECRRGEPSGSGREVVISNGQIV